MAGYLDEKTAAAVPPRSAARQALVTALRGDGTILPAESRLRPESIRLFGSDIGGTKAQSIVTDLAGNVLAEIKEPTAPEGGMVVIDQIACHFRRLVAEIPAGPPPMAAGVGLPGSVHPYTGRLHRLPNIDGLAGKDVRHVLAERLGVPVAVENDVNMAALGEGWRGLGRGCGNFVFVALGTGIGMGTVIGGRLLRGAQGAAGEIASLPIGADPFDPATFASGALESVISSQALMESYGADGGRGGKTLREVFQTGMADSAFDGLLERVARLLAQAILAVVAVVDPELVIFGGGIGSQPELLERTRGHLARCLTEPPECRISALGNRAGVVGAARAARGALADALAGGHGKGMANE